MVSQRVAQAASFRSDASGASLLVEMVAITTKECLIENSHATFLLLQVNIWYYLLMNHHHI